MNKMIKAVGFIHHLPISDNESFIDVTIERPELNDQELLVSVEGVSVNHVDTYVRNSGDKTRLLEPKIIGWDAVGTVIGKGAKATLFDIGDRVWYAGDLKKSGSYTQNQVIDERLVGRAPSKLTAAQAAAIPLVGLTAYEALFEKLKVSYGGNAGQTLLIVNGSGGVGSLAIQLAKLTGLTVIATAAKQASVDWVKQLGADHIIDHYQDLVKQVHDLGYHDVDYCLNLNNLDAHWDELAELIKPDGHIVAVTENRKPIDLQKLAKKRASFSWEWMFSKSYYQLDNMKTQHEILTHLASLYETGKLQTVTTKTYTPINADNMRKAHTDVESGHMVGKVTLVDWEA